MTETSMDEREAAYRRQIRRSWIAAGSLILLNVALTSASSRYGDLTPAGFVAHFLAVSALAGGALAIGRARYWRGRLDQLREDLDG